MRKLWPNNPAHWLAYTQSGSPIPSQARRYAAPRPSFRATATLDRVTGGLVMVVAAMLVSAI